MRKAIVKVYWALRGIREGRYDFLLIGFTAKHIECSCGIHVFMLRKYTPDPTNTVDWGEPVVDVDGTFEEGPVRIMDSREQVL